MRSTRKPGHLNSIPPPRMRSLLKSERMYELKADHEGTLFLDVVVGAPSIHTARLVLDAAERKAWEEGGEKYLDELASAVSGDGPRFSERLTKV